MDTQTMTDPHPPQADDSQIVRVEQDVRREVGDSIEISRALAAAIKDPETRGRAVDMGTDILARIKNLKAKREEIVTPLRRAYERVRDLFDDPIRRLEACKTALSHGISAYDVEAERQRRLERERREAEERRQREEYERKRREWEAAEARRQQEEERRVWEAEEAQRKRLEEERQRKIREEEDSRLRQAQVAQEVGNGQERADHILEHATPIAPTPPPQEVAAAAAPLEALPPPPPPPPPPPAPVQEVASFVADATVKHNVWKAEVEDLMALVRAVADGRAPLYVEWRGKQVPLLEPNVGYLQKQAQMMKDEFRCPGCRAWPERRTDFRLSAQTRVGEVE